MYDDTIAAIASPPGEGGIGIIRLSGCNAASIASRIFRKGKRARAVEIETLQSHHLFYGFAVDPAGERIVDEVMLTRMAAPNSYTREDVVEIYCHSGPVPLREVLRLTLALGARQAEPGEFTLRAFLNGRLDLSQAEAVMAVIAARTTDSLELAIDGLRGRLTHQLAPARAALLEAMAFLDASADFPEDEIPPMALGSTLALAERELGKVVDASRLGLLYREGVQIAIVGRPNVGKSSLLNRLLRAERAIVTEIAGTTRDVISETINLRGLPATLLDTAGIAETADLIEQMGIDRSRRALDSSGVVLFVLDGSQTATEADRHVAALLRQRRLAGSSFPLVIALNKRDLAEHADQGELLRDFPDAPVVEVSALADRGIEALEDVLFDTLRAQAGDAREPALVTLRQQQALARAQQSIQAAQSALDDGLPLDLVAVDAREALLAIGEITGEQVSESILNEIFSRFCIGK